MKATIDNLKRIRNIGETYYHPVLWYLPEYLTHRVSNPEDNCDQPLLNTLRRISAIKRLPSPPMAEAKHVIVRIRLEELDAGTLSICYITEDLSDTLQGQSSRTFDYIQTVDKETFFKYVDVFDLFYSRNRRRASAVDMEMMVTHSRRGRSGSSCIQVQPKDTYYWYDPTQFTELMETSVAQPAMRVILGRHYGYLTHDSEEQLNRISLDPIDDFASQIKKGVAVDRIDNDGVLKLLNISL